MKFNERINIIVTQNDDESLVWESPAENTAGQVEKQARRMASRGNFNKVFVGSISSSCLTEMTPFGAVKNSAGVRFRAKPVVEEIEITDAGLDRIVDDVLPFSIDESRGSSIVNHINNSIKAGKKTVNFGAHLKCEKAKNNNINGTKLQYDTDEFFRDLKEFEAKQHAKEVAQAEKVEKYKRDLLNSREARFYRRFRELGATHEQAVKYAWGDA